MKKIQLTQGFYAIVDNEDYVRLSPIYWSIIRGAKGKIYARGVIDGKHVKMHRFILNAPKGFDVDHRDGNGLNNRKQNLRVCTRTQNTQNRKLSINTSTGLKGVTPRDGSFRAQIQINGKKIHIGTFKTREEAGRAYDKKAIENFGAFANTNYRV